jgi:penicillin amidase
MLRCARALALLTTVLLASALSAQAETLEIPGLSAPAQVQTDDLGVPHITAATLEDAFRVQGWVAARDRLFQMDRGRHGATGTLAELTGSFLDLQQDAAAKSVDLPAAARRNVELMTPETLRLYQAYADGINAWLSTHPLPSEYASSR